MTKADEEILTTLEKGQMTLLGEYVWGSNYTFSVQVEYQDVAVHAVYKPTRGERPLWDFPRASLARREVAAYLVSRALGWDLVPPTVYRKQAPIGPGSLQLFVEHDPEYHYFNFREPDRQRLRPVVLFDLLINNADRKGSHVLIDREGHLWLIDHGVCFHREDKLRTVIWDFAGEPIPQELCAALDQLHQRLKTESELVSQLQAILSQEEIKSLAARARHLLTLNRFPDPHPNRRPYPWPPV
ncbi:MAG: hypothetical protein A2Z45_02935 [Chloroflexi bacterium RBG_19FT_COMBO_55_16]|nr:MAG: hypothetical protein A2Z45_02935 [Chloroflexi bacterium RBG_19FT_COMBO_55_16]